MASKFPESYADPLYAKLDANNENKFGLPPGLLSTVRTVGEKSDASAVSSAGATTPYQFTPTTRRLILDKYGIDVGLSPENASMGAGLLLQESLKRNQNDPEQAVREYHGGTNRENWGPVNDAYWKRVSNGLNRAKVKTLSSDFAQWMKDNPATPAASAAPTPAAANPETAGMSAAFGQWKAQQAAPGGPARPEDQIPLPDGSLGRPANTATPEQSLGDQLIGAGETGLSLLTGATGGLAGTLAGTGAGLVESVQNGTFGTPEGVRNTERLAAEGAQALTYAPRTVAGQQQTAAVGDVLQNAIPVAPLTAEMAAAGRGASAAAGVAREVAAPAVAKVVQAVPKIKENIAAVPGQVAEAFRGVPGGAESAAGTRGSVGAAGTDIATQRTALAENLPVPMRLTKGQAARDQEQLRFEQETAKQPAGQALRENAADQNEILLKNFDNLVDQTGAEAASLRGTGEAVDKALRNEMTRDKTAIRTAYTEARNAGEMEQPVTLGGLIDRLNETATDTDTSPVLGTARKRALKLGAAIEDANGDLVPKAVTLENAEKIRRAIGENTDSMKSTDVRQAAILKSTIDEATADAGGAAYRSARRMRENFAKKYEDRAVVEKLVKNKKGSSDRQVALEDVFNHSILNSSLDDVRALRSTLTKTQGAEGLQAWKELQGQTAQYLKDQATKNIANDIRGNQIVSASGLDKAVRALDADGKLDFIFTKRGAQTIRDLNELAKVVHTLPPGSVNTSNTAATLIGAIAEAGATGALTGLPVPVI